jgi:hypothetical protein
MAPPRQRTTAIVDDSRSEASSGTREYKNPPKSRRPAAAAKDKASVTSAPVDQIMDDQPRVCRLRLRLNRSLTTTHKTKNQQPKTFDCDLTLQS